MILNLDTSLKNDTEEIIRNTGEEGSGLIAISELNSNVSAFFDSSWFGEKSKAYRESFDNQITSITANINELNAIAGQIGSTIDKYIAADERSKIQ